MSDILTWEMSKLLSCRANDCNNHAQIALHVLLHLRHFSQLARCGLKRAWRSAISKLGIRIFSSRQDFFLRPFTSGEGFKPSAKNRIMELEASGFRATILCRADRLHLWKRISSSNYFFLKQKSAFLSGISNT